MTLGVKDRLILLNCLPESGDITTLRIVRQLRESLSFSEEEHATFGISFVGEQIKWDKSEDRDIPIGPKAHSFIAGVLKDLSDRKLLTMQHVPLFEKFVAEE